VLLVGSWARGVYRSNLPPCPSFWRGLFFPPVFIPFHRDSPQFFQNDWRQYSSNTPPLMLFFSSFAFPPFDAFRGLFGRLKKPVLHAADHRSVTACPTFFWSPFSPLICPLLLNIFDNLIRPFVLGNTHWRMMIPFQSSQSALFPHPHHLPSRLVGHM